MTKKAYLLISVGSPNEPKIIETAMYLTRFLRDTLNIPSIFTPFVFLFSLFLAPQYTRQFRAIWNEDGPPLVSKCLHIQKELQKKAGDDATVFLILYFTSQGVDETLKQLSNFEEISLIPLFMQETSFSDSLVQKTHEKLSQIVPKTAAIKVIPPLERDGEIIELIAATISQFKVSDFDALIFSFHSLPVGKSAQTVSPYSIQCHTFAKKIIKKLHYPEESSIVSFQSKMAFGYWCKPDIRDSLKKCLKEGKKKILMVPLSFVSDCSETLWELKIELKDYFLKNGGKELDVVPTIDTHPDFINVLYNVVTRCDSNKF
jgi:protoporphyrin/coproporphyrin ferrochelatase